MGAALRVRRHGGRLPGMRRVQRNPSNPGRNGEPLGHTHHGGARAGHAVEPLRGERGGAQANVLITNAGGDAPVPVTLPVEHIRRQHSLFTELFETSGCSSRVNLLSRYGMCRPPFSLASPRSASALITLPKHSRPPLMCTASRKRAPTVPVRLLRSEPAKSTRWNLEAMRGGEFASVGGPRRRCSTVTVKIA